VTFFPANLLDKYWKTKSNTTKAKYAATTKYKTTQNKYKKQSGLVASYNLLETEWAYSGNSR